MGTHPIRPFGAAFAALAAVLAAAPAPAFAQEGAALAVTVTSAATREPIPGARVGIEGTQLGGVSDEDGSVLLTGIPAGLQVMRVEVLGYSGFRAQLNLNGGRTREVEVKMEVNPIRVAPLRATGARGSAGDRMLQARGFYDRQHGGAGVFLNREELLRQNPRSMAQLLSRHARLNVAYDARSPTQPRTRAQRMQQSRRCQPDYVLDGVHVFNFDPNTLRPENIEGIEIYRGASEVPPAFSRGGSACGAVVIWTRVN